VSAVRPRVLVVYREVGAHGGGSVVAAWALAALKERYDVSLLTWADVDYEGLRKYYGIELSPEDFEVILVPSVYRPWFNFFPTPGAQLQLGLIMNACKRLLRGRDFEVVLGADNEADFGRRGIQYVHYPWAKYPRPDYELRWYHRIPGLLRLYRFATITALGCSWPRIRQNATLANSEFVASEVQDTHRIEPRVLYPPVLGPPSDVAWEERQSRIVCIGRIHRCKRWLDAVEIVKRVRECGYDLKLCVIGNEGDAAYLRELRRLERKHGDWFRLVVDAPHSELMRIVSESKFGMHCMVEEHFGIAVAELVLAGCIPFVNDSGGPPEIVGMEPVLRFESIDQAAERIEKVLRDPTMQDELRTRLLTHGQRFGVDQFQDGVREAVSEFLSATASARANVAA